MKKPGTHRIAFIILIFFYVHGNAQTNPAIETKVTNLLKQMTLEEKVGQMAQVSIESLGSNQGTVFSFGQKMTDAVVNFKIGSVLNTPGPLQSPQDWNRIISEIQDAAAKTRLKIPILYG